MNILHSSTDPSFVERLKQMLGSANAADIAVGYLFISGFNVISDELARLEKVRVLVGRTEKQTLEEIARGVQQKEPADAVVRIAPRDDDKLRAIREFMERPEVAAGKLLIFSEAEATV